MTVSSTASRVAYTGNGSTTAFAFTWRFLATTDIAVYVDGTLQSTGYSVSSPGSSGTVTFVTAPANGTSVVIRRATAQTQETDYVANDAFSADVTELAFDRAMLAAQDNAAAIGRTLRAPDYAAAVNALSEAELLRLQTIAAGGEVAVAAATEAQAEAGTDNGTYMTPLRVAQAKLNQTASGGFFVQNGARVNRMNDRVFIGGATLNDGLFPNVAQDWFTQFQVSIGVPVGTAVSSIVNVMNAGTTSETGAVGVLAAIQSKYFASAGTAAIGTGAFVVNNHATLATNAWSIYGEAHKTTTASGSVYACELDTRNTVASIAPTPFQQGDVIGLQIVSGAEYSTGFDGSAAIQIVNNLDKWKVGINFISTSITGTDGVTGTGTAIAFARGHAMRWYNSSGVRIAEIVTNLTTAANGTSIAFSELGLQVLNSTGNAMAYFFPVASAANQVTFTAGAAGTSPLIAAIGSDTNVDLRLDGQGTGRIRFGTYTAGAVAQAGYIEVKDAGGTIRRLLVG